MERRLVITKEISLISLDEVILPQVSKGVDRYYLDLSGLEYCDAPSSIYLLLLLGYIGKISKEQPILIPPVRPNIVSFLNDMRVFVNAENICFINKTREFPRPVDTNILSKWNITEVKSVWSKINDKGFYNTLGAYIPNTIITKFTRMLGQAEINLGEIVSELIKNIFEHSQSYGFVAAQIVDSSFKTIIGDIGIGIFESLKPYYYRNVTSFERKHGPVWDNAKALDLAFAPGITSKADGTGGAGLFSVLNTVKKSGGILVCQSGTDRLFMGTVKNRWVTQRKKCLFFPGTQLEVTIPIPRRS